MDELGIRGTSEQWGTDWQERINWQRLRDYRLARAREAMRRLGLGAMLLIYDENVRVRDLHHHLGWNR